MTRSSDDAWVTRLRPDSFEWYRARSAALSSAEKSAISVEFEAVAIPKLAVTNRLGQ